MTTTTTNGGGTRNTRLPLLEGGSPYGHSYSYHYKYGRPTDEEDDSKILTIMFPAFAGILFIFIWLLCVCVRKGNRQEQHAAGGVGAAGGGNTFRRLRPTGQSSELVDTAPPSSTVAAVDVEMPPPVRAADEPPLVCTYREADGWRDGSCGVCLAELADGEAIRVLPACMHYFHAACVGEWLRAHATCPLCRALIVAPAAAVA